MKPNGRDGKDGTGRSPQSPAAHRADTPRSFQTSKQETRTCA
ncbi:hypothetical protein A3768_2447 [Ralstonia solanacearum]|nr:hypothetical protein F504_1101 [Ralstonia pseudosolanacearum FQY_4]ANH33590.1 hypothetical protein A3768_2447 [Ralstonia solanacearum]